MWDGYGGVLGGSQTARRAGAGAVGDGRGGPRRENGSTRRGFVLSGGCVAVSLQCVRRRCYGVVMARTKSGNARSAAMHMRTTPAFYRYVEGVCEEEQVTISSFMRESVALLLELRRDFTAAAAKEGLPLTIFVKRAVKDYVERTTP